MVSIQKNEIQNQNQKRLNMQSNRTIEGEHNSVSKTNVHKPLLISPDYLPEEERFNKDFATYDKMKRQ